MHVQPATASEVLFCRWQQEAQELAGLLEPGCPALLAVVSS